MEALKNHRYKYRVVNVLYQNYTRTFLGQAQKNLIFFRLDSFSRSLGVFTVAESKLPIFENFAKFDPLLNELLI